MRLAMVVWIFPPWDLEKAYKLNLVNIVAGLRKTVKGGAKCVKVAKNPIAERKIRNFDIARFFS